MLNQLNSKIHMKLSYKVLALGAAMLMGGFSSCASFLDVVPDENVTDKDTYSGRGRGLGYLYSCYAYLPSHATTAGGLDRMTGDETVSSFEHESFASFLKGNYTAANPVISYWNTLFQGIRQCYMFKERVPKLPSEDVTDEEKADMLAQADFLIGYYHFLLIRCYGPTIVVRELPNINTTVNDFPEREKLDDCVAFVVEKLDEAAKVLPATRTGNVPFSGQQFYGLATSVMAKAVKAKMLLYAASPLFNGGMASAYADFKNSAGEHLMPQVADPQKWVKAKEAIKDAIDHAERSGHALYNKADAAGTNPYPATGSVERKLRYMLIDWTAPNPEVLFADTRGDGYYDLQLKSVPRIKNKAQGANGVSPTWVMLNRFYTKNGLPWNVDPATKDLDPLSLTAIDTEHNKHGVEGQQTLTFNLHREPRFYAWVGFHNGFFEIRRENANVYDMPHGDGRVVLNMLKDGPHGRQSSGEGSSNNYSPGGYLNKKGTNPNAVVTNSGTGHIYYPFAVIRLADLYLAYAEASVETGDLATAKTYLNKVRERAGIPTVETAWETTAGITLDQSKLREIVRQERQVELYLENQNFWDMRRWLLADQTFGQKSQGLNIESTTLQGFNTLTTIPFERKFEKPKNYLLPIPSTDINRNTKIVQNPGY